MKEIVTRRQCNEMVQHVSFKFQKDKTEWQGGNTGKTIAENFFEQMKGKNRKT